MVSKKMNFFLPTITDLLTAYFLFKDLHLLCATDL